MKKFALNIGCSKENPSTFFLRHIYASQVIKEVNDLHYKGSIYEAYKILHQEELFISVYIY
jgi:hypothetical protein